MTFAAESLTKTPQDGNGRAYAFKRRTKVLSAGSAAALETALNAWLAVLEVDTLQYVVGAAMPYVPANNTHAVVVSYGWFEAEIY
jgi:hypothetical protein